MLDAETAHAEDLASSKSAVQAIEKASEEERLEYERLLQVSFRMLLFVQQNSFVFLSCK